MLLSSVTPLGQGYEIKLETNLHLSLPTEGRKQWKSTKRPHFCPLSRFKKPPNELNSLTLILYLIKQLLCWML